MLIFKLVAPRRPNGEGTSCLAKVLPPPRFSENLLCWAPATGMANQPLGGACRFNELGYDRRTNRKLSSRGRKIRAADQHRRSITSRPARRDERGRGRCARARSTQVCKVDAERLTLDNSLDLGHEACGAACGAPCRAHPRGRQPAGKPRALRRMSQHDTIHRCVRGCVWLCWQVSRTR